MELENRYGYHWHFWRGRVMSFCLVQTLLEKIKTLYNDTPGLSPDKIGPTVGQNSTFLSRCSVLSNPTSRQWEKSLSLRLFFNSGTLAANVVFALSGIDTTTMRTPLSTWLMLKTEKDSVKDGRCLVCPFPSISNTIAESWLCMMRIRNRPLFSTNPWSPAAASRE